MRVVTVNGRRHLYLGEEDANADGDLTVENQDLTDTTVVHPRYRGPLFNNCTLNGTIVRANLVRKPS